MSINERLIQILIKDYGKSSDITSNGVPLRFLWSKLNDEERARNGTLFKCVSDSDFLIAFLSNLDYDEQQRILQECSDTVLHAILSNWWWWGNYFLPTALNVLDFMNPRSFWEVLNRLSMEARWNSDKNVRDQFKSLFKLLWEERSTEFKEFILRDDARELKLFLAYRLNWEKDMDVIEVILKDLNAQLKKNIILSEYIVGKCDYLVYKDKWASINSLFNCAFFSDEDISQMKQNLIQKSGRKLAASFLRQREFHQLDRFLNWAFQSDEEVASFRHSVNYEVPSSIQ